MPIVSNLFRYNKGYLFSKVMFNRLTLKAKVLQVVQLTRRINLIKISCFCPKKLNNQDRNLILFVLTNIVDFRLLNMQFKF